MPNTVGLIAVSQEDTMVEADTLYSGEMTIEDIMASMEADLIRCNAGLSGGGSINHNTSINTDDPPKLMKVSSVINFHLLRPSLSYMSLKRLMKNQICSSGSSSF